MDGLNPKTMKNKNCDKMDEVIVKVPLPSVEVRVEVDETDDMTKIQEAVLDKMYGNYDWSAVQETIGDSLRDLDLDSVDIVEIRHEDGSVTIP